LSFAGGQFNNNPKTDKFIDLTLLIIFNWFSYLYINYYL